DAGRPAVPRTSPGQTHHRRTGGLRRGASRRNCLSATGRFAPSEGNRIRDPRIDHPPPHLPANSARNNADPTVIGEGEAPAEPHFALPPYISPSLIQPSHLALDPSPVKLNVAIAGQTPSPAFLTAVISNLVASAPHTSHSN